MRLAFPEDPPRDSKKGFLKDSLGISGDFLGEISGDFLWDFVKEAIPKLGRPFSVWRNP